MDNNIVNVCWEFSLSDLVNKETWVIENVWDIHDSIVSKEEYDNFVKWYYI